MDNTISMISKIVMEDNAAVRGEFLKHFDQEIAECVKSVAAAHENWQKFAATAGEHEQKNLVSLLIYYAINSLINSLTLLVNGYIVASGNLMRHAIEAVPTAILCSKGSATYYDKFRKNRFPVHKAPERLLRRRTDFNVKKQAVERLMKARKFYHRYSHPTPLSVTSVTPLGQEGDAYLGPSFDNRKTDGYKKEFSSITGFANLLANTIDEINLNAKWV